MLGRISSFFGPLSTVSKQSNLDADAQAFILAANITDTTQKSAINQLVVDLKSYGIWSKMKAIYPMVGGTSTSHKWNLKDPRDLDAAFRLVFSGGWTHTSTGALPNGTNGYANTYLDSQNNLSLNSGHFSFYSRTNAVTGAIRIDMGSLKSSPDSYSDLVLSASNLTYFRFNNGVAYDSSSSLSTLGFFVGSRTLSNIIKLYRNGSIIVNGVASSSATSAADYFIGASNNQGVGFVDTPQYFSNRECSFASIGDGLTDTETTNFYTAVQAYQTTLGRSIGSQIVSDPDAQAFVTAANIEDQVQAQAVNQLVIDMKAANIWTKMKAVYPFVGGTAASHKWNLKNPLDTNAAFRLTFNGGWTHSSTGATPNGTNGYADTFLVPSTAYPNSNSGHLSIYMRTNTNIASVDIGCAFVLSGVNRYNLLSIRRSDVSGTTFYMNFAYQGLWASFVDTNSAAFYIGTRNAGTINGFRNTVKVATINSTPDALPPHNTILGAYSLNGALQPGLYSNREYAFASIGDGLTDTEAANFYTMVQTFNTTLNRQV